MPNLSLMTAGLHSTNFVGCIAEVLLNDQKLDIMFNSIDERNVRACKSWTRQIRQHRTKINKK